MTVWNIDTNAEAKAMVITADFSAAAADVWRLWADPRLLERWWAPPGYPARFEFGDLVAGTQITYTIGNPDSPDRFDGTWNVVEAEAPKRLVLEDAIVDDDGTPSDGNSMTRMDVDIETGVGTTRMSITIRFDSIEGMQEAIATGVAEGMKACMAQIDELLAAIAG